MGMSPVGEWTSERAIWRISTFNLRRFEPMPRALGFRRTCNSQRFKIDKKSIDNLCSCLRFVWKRVAVKEALKKYKNLARVVREVDNAIHGWISHYPLGSVVLFCEHLSTGWPFIRWIALSSLWTIRTWSSMKVEILTAHYMIELKSKRISSQLKWTNSSVYFCALICTKGGA